MGLHNAVFGGKLTHKKMITITKSVRAALNSLAECNPAIKNKLSTLFFHSYFAPFLEGIPKTAKAQHKECIHKALNQTHSHVRLVGKNNILYHRATHIKSILTMQIIPLLPGRRSCDKKVAPKI